MLVFAVLAAGGKREPPAPTARLPRDFPFLPGEPVGSVSLGDTSTGRLVRGAFLEESEALAILPRQRTRAQRWGTTELVGALTHAAQELHRQTGTRLWVGHLSRRGGGDIPYSVSHNSGRDADIAFAYRDADGHAVDPDALITVTGDGRAARRGLFFDAPRTWLIVKALITYEPAQIQYLFMSRALEGRLLMHAKARGEPKAIRRRAEALMHQPGRGAARHQDHIHLRLYCSADDVRAGCQNSGRVWSFAKLHRRDRARFAMGLSAPLSSPDGDLRRRALERIGLLDAKLLAPSVRASMDDPQADVRRAAAVTLVRFGETRHEAWVDDWLKTRPASERRSVARALLASRVERAGPVVGGILDDLPAPRPLIEMAGDSGLLGCVPALVRRLADPDGTTREAAARALGRLTATRYVRDWRTASAETMKQGRRKWRHAWSAGAGLSRRAWLMRGFHRAGLEVGRLDPVDAWALVAALNESDHLAFNAARRLRELFGRRASCASWQSWLQARQQAYELPPAPAHLCRRTASSSTEAQGDRAR
jgi:murein endopeptidase